MKKEVQQNNWKKCFSLDKKKIKLVLSIPAVLVLFSMLLFGYGFSGGFSSSPKIEYMVGIIWMIISFVTIIPVVFIQSLFFILTGSEIISLILSILMYLTIIYYIISLIQLIILSIKEVRRKK